MAVVVAATAATTLARHIRHVRGYLPATHASFEGWWFVTASFVTARCRWAAMVHGVTPRMLEFRDARPSVASVVSVFVGAYLLPGGNATHKKGLGARGEHVRDRRPPGRTLPRAVCAGRAPRGDAQPARAAVTQLAPWCWLRARGAAGFTQCAHVYAAGL
eukprot:scaffold17182_cov75-Phaeocystis_antarctica.AAC.3